MGRVAVAIVILLTTTAHAQLATGDAKTHFKQATVAMDIGAYLKAADEFKTAYGLDPRPEILFNIAQAYRLAGKLEDALDYYEKYLMAQPGGLGAAEAKRYVAELRKALEVRKPIEGDRQQPPPSPMPSASPTLLSYSFVETGGSKRLRVSGLVTAGVGLAAVALGVKFGLDARSDAQEVSKVTIEWTPDKVAIYNHGLASDRNMVISYVVGGALLAGGGVMYWLGARTHLSAEVTTRSASVGMRGEF